MNIVQTLYDRYQNDEEFKEYVDKYCVKTNISVEEALTHKIVEEYLDYLLKRI